MSRPELSGENLIQSFEKLVGGPLVADEVSGGVDDPDEDPAMNPRIIFGRTDRLDILEAVCTGMNDVSFGVLTQRISVSDLHRRDQEAIRLDRELQERIKQNQSI